MYRNTFKYFNSFFQRNSLFKRKNIWNHNKLLSLSLVTFAAYNTKKYFMFDQSQSKTLKQHIKQAYQAQQQMKKIIQVQVCNSQDIKQSQIYPTKVKNKDATQYTILIIRYGGKLYAVGGQCTHKDPLNLNQSNKTLHHAISFNDKLVCPHHGCAFDIKSGTVQYGPATINLPIFSVIQRVGKVILNYPQKIPKGVNPKTVPRDFGDQRKVVILGQDHNATAGCIDGLRQYGFDGQISLILQHTQLPYRKDILHKSIVNLKLKQKYKKLPVEIDKEIENILEQKIYSKIRIHDQKWYQQHGIQFVYNYEPYRIIHKRFYPYLTFFDGTKKQYDGLVIATDVIPFVDRLNGITANKDGKPYVPDNVFIPFRNKIQHLKMLKFLNKHQVKNMIVYGVDQFSLQFLQQIHKQFPNIKIQVLDTERQNKLYQIYGQQLTLKILKQYTTKNMEFFMRIDQKLTTSNKLQNDLYFQNIQNKQPNQNKVTTYNDQQIKNSIQIIFGQGNHSAKLQGDCLVYFPSKYQGNTGNIKKKSKYTDFDFTQQNKIATQPTQKTDTARIFSIGTVAQNQYFFTKARLNTFNPNVLYQQGFNCALNLLALDIPFTYIPIQITQHFGKKLYHIGSQTYINQMYVMGSIQNWDFMIIYAKNNKIYSAVASQSRQKQLQIMRQAFRLQCEPQFQSFVQDQWNVPKIYKLIKKINKSYCYRDQIHKIEDTPVKSNIIWVQRSKGVGFGNDKPMSEDQSGFQIDQRGYVRQV